ncbi:MAG TPA: helix-turn-helix transcriptional regulator [Terriglobales bacterium]|nr:helix-turn-helix transcriptional regulator [Terriglobales bacterium]
MYPPGLRLRQARESLGLTYREVEQSSYEIAAKRGRPEFVLHISRLADIENRNVVPSLHKLYSLATIYHLNPLKISGWYEAPFLQTFDDGAAFPAPLTHLSESPAKGEATDTVNADKDFHFTDLWNKLPSAAATFPGMKLGATRRFRYGFIGLSDRRMAPILRPGSIVLVDTALRRIEDEDWLSEYDRPLFFVETRAGYRCGWFQKLKSRLIMQPHMLSRCTPEAWRTPEEAEIVGKVVGMLTYLNEPWSCARGASRTEPANWIEKAL